jgi:fumarate reductase subunit C
MPPQFPAGGRYRAYVAFDATGLLYLMVGFIALRIVWTLGNGEAEWARIQGQLSNPLYIGFHVLMLLSLLFVGVRFFRLFPKAQLPHIGPLTPPPQPVILGGLYAAWIGITALMVAILSGGIF